MQYYPMKNILAGCLLVALTGGLTACTQTEQRLSSAEQGVQELAEKTEEAVSMQATEENSEQRSDLEVLQSLRPGQPLTYYTNEFNRMNYQVVGAKSMENHRVFDLHKNQRRFLVSLVVPENGEQVSDIDVRQYRVFRISEPGRTTQMGQETGAVPELTNEAALKTVTNLQELQPGKKAHEYIPMISQYGRVTEYEAEMDQAEIELEGPDKRFYQVKMTLDPRTQQVTRITTEREVWEAL